MKEHELNVIMSVASEPVENIYKINNHKDLEEIQRIIRIFKIADSQELKHQTIAIKNLASLKLVLSNN